MVDGAEETTSVVLDPPVLHQPLGLEAPLERRLGVAAPRVEPRRDKDVLARKAAVAQGAADAGLVAVGLGSVDVAVAGLQRPAHRVLTLGPIGDLPPAQPEQRALVCRLLL